MSIFIFLFYHGTFGLWLFVHLPIIFFLVMFKIKIVKNSTSSILELFIIEFLICIFFFYYVCVKLPVMVFQILSCIIVIFWLVIIFLVQLRWKLVCGHCCRFRSQLFKKFGGLMLYWRMINRLLGSYLCVDLVSCCFLYLKRLDCYLSSISSIVLPHLSVVNESHILLWLLKSPVIIYGVVV